MHAIRDDPENHPSLRGARQSCAQEGSRAAANLTIMSVAPTTFDELTDHGVLEKPHLNELLDSQDLKVLEERFLTKGTVIVTKDDVLLQAVQVRGSGRAREVWFAPSSLSRTVAAAAKIRASEVYSSEAVTHVFMNVLGATFVMRENAGDAPNTMQFKVVLLPAPASAKELESDHVVAMLSGAPVGQPIVVCLPGGFSWHMYRLGRCRRRTLDSAGQVQLAESYTYAALERMVRLDPVVHRLGASAGDGQRVERATPLFRVAGRTLRTERLRRFARQIMRKAGQGTASVGAHSFRIGGATDLADQGASPLLLQAKGRWASDIGRIYARMTRRAQLAASRLMQRRGARDLEELFPSFAQAA